MRSLFTLSSSSVSHGVVLSMLLMLPLLNKAQNTTVASAAPAEINIKQDVTSIASNNVPAYNFTSRMVGARNTVAFTIENLGGAPLTLGAYTVTAGANFTVVGRTPSVVAASGSATFYVRFEPSTVGVSTGTISIANNDSNENPYVLNFTGTGLAPTFVTWTGHVDASWFNPLNWSTMAVPSTTDNVLLDNTVVTTGYTVKMTGTALFPASPVMVQSLTVNPKDGPAIALVVPATNTLNPALTLTSTEAALSIYDKGTVSNHTGAVSGFGIDVLGAAPSVFIYNGGTYEHATVQAATAVTENLASPGGTEGGTFLFNVTQPLAGTVTQPSLQGKVFGNLTFRAGDRTAGYAATGSSFIINGNLTVINGSFFDNGMAETDLGGSIISYGKLNFTNPSGLLLFNGLTVQGINGNEFGFPGSGNYLGSGVIVRLNNTAGLNLSTPVRVNNILDLVSGSITTSTANMLTLPANPTGSSSSFVNGPLVRVINPGAATVFFPIGKGTAYRPLTLTITAQTSTTTYTAEQKEGVPTDQVLIGAVKCVSSIRSFSVTPDSPPTGFSGTITLSFDADDQVTDPATASFIIAKSDGSGWSNIGRTANTGTANAGAFVAGTLTSAPFTSFSDFALANIDAITTPLPVQLTSFSAKRQATNAVAVRWTTASEKNSAYFEVQRSFDARGFVTIAKLLAQGNSTSSRATAYVTTDEQAPAGLLYYRLRQVDTDGKTAYSPVVTIAGEKADLALYPNPVQTTLYLATAAATPYRVLNPMGQVLLQGTTVAGTATIAVGPLAPGLYHLELQTSTGRAMRKFVKE